MEVGVKKRKRSLGKACTVPFCSSTTYRKDGSPSAISFFKFPSKSREQNRWCNLIKRQNGRDGFKVGKHTVVCEKHFDSKQVKRIPGGTRKRLRIGAEPTQFDWSNSPKKSRNPPKDRLMVQVSTKVKVAQTLNFTSAPGFAENPSPILKVSENLIVNQSSGSLSKEPTSEASLNLLAAEKETQTDPSIGWSKKDLLVPDHTYCSTLKSSETSTDLSSLHQELLKKQQDVNKLRERIGQLEQELHNYEARN